ncbi:TonB-dependent receptor plug domain-containing protein [Sphingomonas aliaeris]|nr:TonB-dependent receptor [Sphingomonas aliaeris]
MMSTYSEIRRCWLTGAATIALATAAQSAGAQTVDTPAIQPQGTPPGTIQTDPVATDDNAASATQDIVVTGSRIRSQNLKSEAPIQSVGEEAIERSGVSLASELLTDLPQFGSTFGNSNQNSNTAAAGFNTGVELVNLRNLGVQRTLVLVNNRRHVGGDPGTSSVDLNSIPSSMISRIDVVTGAASAVYGADAVSGVVNIILKDNVEDLTVSGRSGISSRGDGGQVQFSAVMGGRFADDRGRFTIGAEYSRDDGIIAGNRAYGLADGLNNRVDLAGGSTGIPGGTISGGANGTFIFDLQNRLVPAAGQPLSETRYQRAPRRSQLAANERFLLSANGRYSLIDGDGGASRMEAYFETGYANARTRLAIEPQVIFFQGLPRLGTEAESPADAPAIPANNPFLLPLIPTIGAVPASGVQVLRRISELGDRGINVERETFRIVGGLRGELAQGVNYDIYYQHGTVRAVQEDTEVFDRFRLAAALNVDNNGTPTNLADDRCVDARYRSLGCIPLNVFGVNSISPQFLAYAVIPSVSVTKATQDVVSGYISADLFSLPGGKATIVGGGEYRRESVRYDPAASNLDRSSSVRFLDASDGSYTVTEQFGEVRLPLLRDLPFVRALSLGGAARYSKYSTIGSEFTYNVRADWMVDSWLRLRGTTGTAVRAPNINELRAPQSRANSTAFDPCDRFTDTGAPITLSAVRATNCTTALGALAATLNQTQIQRDTVASQNSGNPNLTAEKARTYTGGVVFTPQAFLRGLSLSADYYQIKIDRVISTLSVQDTVNQCYDQAGLPGVFCDRVSRDPVNGQLIGVNNQLFNAATEEVQGVDVQLLYGLGLGNVGGAPARLNLRGSYALLLKHDFVARAGAAVDRRVSQVGDARHRVQAGATLALGSGRFSWDTRFVSRSVADTTATGAAALNNTVPRYFVHDAQISVDATRSLRLDFGLQNVFDKQPPIVTNPSRTVSGGTIAGGVYDVRGRYFYVSGVARF